ncbi:MAG TPA: dihydrolipoyl dehydrogenase [Candidatus Tectomicrobia bacterium]|nr:dihydrolipoyl dehydrogenase [Candidatus Tectomicrobia bacterium]
MVMGEIERDAQVVVIGGGPGGYAAAFRAADLGKEVVLIEAGDALGGECLHHGCIPSKALLTATHLLDQIAAAHAMGIRAADVSVDPAAMRQWKDGVLAQLSKGLAQLAARRSIEVVHGKATFTGSRRLRISNGGAGTLTFEQAIVATGSRPLHLPGIEVDGERVMTSREALRLRDVPERLLVVGGGYIGLELGSVYARLGSHVTVVELTEQLLPGIDRDLVQVIHQTLRKRGVEVHLRTKVTGIRHEGGNIAIDLAQGDGTALTIEADRALVAVGRRPNTDDLGLEQTRVKRDERGFIQVDAQRRTTDARIYAVGDVTGEPMLAHKAAREGKVAAEAIAGEPAAFDNVTVPAVVFTDPEIAFCGLSEEQARAAGYTVKVGKFPFRALGRALTLNATDGFVKVIADTEHDTLLGVRMVGPDVSDLISEAVLGLEMGAQLEDFAASIHPHPTLSEALAEAAEAALDRAIHLYHPLGKTT